MNRSLSWSPFFPPSSAGMKKNCQRFLNGSEVLSDVVNNSVHVLPLRLE